MTIAFKYKVGVLACCVITVLLAPYASAAPFVPNNSFEDVQIGPPFFSRNPADIPGWTHTGSPGDALLWAIGYSDGGGNITTAGQGRQFVTLGGGFGNPGSATWSTIITGLTPGTTYDLTFMIAAEGPFAGPQLMTVGFSSGSSTPSSTFLAPPSAGNYWKTWGTQNYFFMANSTNATVDFSVFNQPFDMGLDNVNVRAIASTIPEPSSILMLGSGLLGLISAVRKRRS